MVNHFDNLNSCENTFCDIFIDQMDNYDLSDFPINNLGDIDLSQDSFLAHEIFPDTIQSDTNEIRGKKSKGKKK